MDDGCRVLSWLLGGGPASGCRLDDVELLWKAIRRVLDMRSNDFEKYSHRIRYFPEPRLISFVGLHTSFYSADNSFKFMCGCLPDSQRMPG